MGYLDLARDVANDFSGKCEIGVRPKGKEWTSLSLEAATKDHEESDMKQKRDTETHPFPVSSPRKHAALHPTTTGAGRELLLCSVGEDDDDLWTFQIGSGKTSSVVLKDKTRVKVGTNSVEYV